MAAAACEAPEQVQAAFDAGYHLADASGGVRADSVLAAMYCQGLECCKLDIKDDVTFAQAEFSQEWPGCRGSEAAEDRLEAFERYCAGRLRRVTALETAIKVDGESSPDPVESPITPHRSPGR